VEVEGASKDKKKKKDRRNDDDEEDTTGGSMMGEEEKGKKDDNKDGAREREREEKEKKEKKSSESSSEEEEEKKNGTEVEIPKRSRRQLKKAVELNEMKKQSSESSEKCCDDKLKKTQEGHHIEARKGLTMDRTGDWQTEVSEAEVADLLQGLPTVVSETEFQHQPIKIEDLIRKKRDHHEGHVEIPKSQTHARQGLAAAGEEQQVEVPPKSQTHARQGHAANQENQKRENRDHHEGHSEPPKSQTHARQGLAAAGDEQQVQVPPKSQTHARQGHAANLENQKREQRDANEEVPDETYGDPISTTASPEEQSEQREKRDDDEIGPKVVSTPMSLNNPANPEGGAVFTEIINSPQMRKRRQLITENGQLYDTGMHPTEDQPILEEMIESKAVKRVERTKRENEMKREAEVNDGEKLNLNQAPAKAHTHARQGHAANPDNHQH